MVSWKNMKTFVNHYFLNQIWKEKSDSFSRYPRLNADILTSFWRKIVSGETILLRKQIIKPPVIKFLSVHVRWLTLQCYCTKLSHNSECWLLQRAKLKMGKKHSAMERTIHQTYCIHMSRVFIVVLCLPVVNRKEKKSWRLRMM